MGEMFEALDRAVDAQAEAAFAFLEALVSAPSVVGAEQATLEVFAGEAEVLGFQVERLPFENGPVAHGRAGVAPPVDRVSPGRYQVLATTPGQGDIELLLNGHIDVVPAEISRTVDVSSFCPAATGRAALWPRRGRHEERLRGRSPSATRALGGGANLFKRRRLGWLAVIEEECTGNGALRSIITHAVTAKEVLLLEPTGLGLLVGGVGVLWADIGVAARSGHARGGGVPASAVDLGLRLIERLRQWSLELASSDPEPTMGGGENPYNLNLGQVRGGDWTSTVPSSASFGIRIGFPRGWSASRAEEELRRVVASFASLEGFPISPRVTLTGFRAEGYLLDENSDLLRDLGAAHRAAHGVEPKRFTLGSTTDARAYLNGFGIPAVCYGASAYNIHGVDESVDLQSIVDAARTVSRFLLARFGSREQAA